MKLTNIIRRPVGANALGASWINPAVLCLGVVYVVTSGDQNRLEVAEALGKELERHMVAVAVGAA